jgi:transposase InsO family protein
LRCCWPEEGRVFLEPEVSAVLMKITDVLRQQPFEMPLVQRDHVIQQILTATSYPSLGNPVLPGTTERGLPKNIRRLIVEMATNNPTWGQERVADELSLKLGILVSPRTVKKYWPEGVSSGPRRISSQRWKIFVHNHASALVACDFATVVTATFRRLYMLVVMEIGTRKILHCNVTAHPTAEWTAQQFREAILSDHSYRFLIHDRDSIFSAEVDQTVENLGLKALRTPVRAPQANAYCERLIGTMRRECLDFMIPFNEKHLRTILREWVRHYNHGRPHRSLGPGLPVPSSKPTVVSWTNRHQIPQGWRVMKKSILGGLHHEYELKKVAA